MVAVGSPVVITVIQARTGSTRLPNKVLADIDGLTMIERVHQRCLEFGYPVIVTPPVLDVDFQHFLIDKGIEFFYGSEKDVLSRYVNCMNHYQADHVVRVCGDSPLIDPEAARITIRHHLDSGADFTHYPAEGRGVEVFTRYVLEESDQRGQAIWYREHPDEWILQNRHLYEIEELKFSVDTAEELERMRKWLDTDLTLTTKLSTTTPPAARTSTKAPTPPR